MSKHDLPKFRLPSFRSAVARTKTSFKLKNIKPAIDHKVHPSSPAALLTSKPTYRRLKPPAAFDTTWRPHTARTKGRSSTNFQRQHALGARFERIELRQENDRHRRSIKRVDGGMQPSGLEDEDIAWLNTKGNGGRSAYGMLRRVACAAGTKGEQGVDAGRDVRGWCVCCGQEKGKSRGKMRVGVRYDGTVEVREFVAVPIRLYEVDTKDGKEKWIKIKEERKRKHNGWKKLQRQLLRIRAS